MLRVGIALQISWYLAATRSQRAAFHSADGRVGSGSNSLGLSDRLGRVKPNHLQPQKLEL